MACCWVDVVCVWMHVVWMVLKLMEHLASRFPVCVVIVKWSLDDCGCGFVGWIPIQELCVGICVDLSW